MEHQESWIAPPRDDGPLVVSVWGGKGGITKSTVAFLSAYMLGQLGPTLLINADSKQTDGGVTEMAQNLAVPIPFELTESDDPAELHSVRQMTQFRYVVTDNGPHRDLEKIRAAADGDLTIVPLMPERSVSKAVMGSIRDHLSPMGANYRILLSKVEYTSLGRARQTKTSLRDLGLPVFDTWLRKYGAHEMLDGQPVFLSQELNAYKAAADAYAMGDELLAALGEPYKVIRLGAPA
ncbi:hypothetical protein QMK19_28885 [Streptomyces sp. H10-C2]|uniref:hypothetical protein n=1 Tax=Streptomyces TaxID=1883 RepID=UPI0018E04589|nr:MULTISPECIES: hypothetical protein [Streptomyces]MDJ0344226.1 hypothetical protein [Streptomyces sp. PH10-H1]MDJ0373564.1 hypothetical protein [Streptomyces sp. H10-C2]